MKKNIIKTVLLFIALSAGNFLAAQIYKTSTGEIKFHSHTNMEDIDATNNTVAAAMSASSGAVEFSVSINSFQFKKALMQKHFQENYMETSKYPKSTFKGKITNKSAVDFNKNGTYSVTVSGKLTIHGVVKDVSIPGTVTVNGNTITLKADFKVKPKDYKIKIPAANAAQIADEIEVSVNCALTKK